MPASPGPSAIGSDAGLADASRLYPRRCFTIRSASDVASARRRSCKASAAHEDAARQGVARRRSRRLPSCCDFALAEGQSAFGDNCAPCHGSGGRAPRAIPTSTTMTGCGAARSRTSSTPSPSACARPDPDTRQSQMPRFRPRRHPEAGADRRPDRICRARCRAGRRLRRRSSGPRRCSPTTAPPATAPQGKGNQRSARPNLTDAIWLYGADSAPTSTTRSSTAMAA